MAQLTVAELIKLLGACPNQSAQVRLASAAIGGATDTTADTVTSAAHGLGAGDRLRCVGLTTSTGLVVGSDYFVIASGLTSGVFKLSATLGGSAFDITGANGSAQFAKQTVSALVSYPAAATLPVDAPSASAPVPGVVTFN